ncbi:MAG TPA: hypothetical protein VII60_02875 [Acidimicrobiales bacterium]
MPKRTGSALHHLRVTTLIAFLVANLALIGIFAPSVASATEIYGYSCCGGGFGTVNYHPSEAIKIDWIQTALRSSGAPVKMVDLSAKASGPFPTIAAAKKAITGSHPVVGRTVFSATTLQVSDEKKESPVSLLHVPPSAGKGFYALTFKIVKGKNTGSGGLIFTVKP